MAAFTSTQSGSWSDGATWGNASPGVKGMDWPGAAGDTFTVSAGHTVDYDVSEANELGQGDLSGKLSFENSADRLLTFSHVNLNIASGGELEIGTPGSEFPAAQTARVLWNTTGDNAKGLQIANGGKLTIYGASGYCTSYTTTLADDAENTDGDTVIKTADDMSADWHVGDEITLKVEKNGDVTSYVDAIKKGVIQSFDGVDGTLITLDISITAAVGVGNTWTSPVVNVTRNVEFGKLGADVACGDGSTHYNTQRPQFIDGNASGNNNCVVSYAQLTGFRSIDSNYQFQFLNSILRNGYYGFYYGFEHTISGTLYGLYMAGYYVRNATVTADLVANSTGFRESTSNILSGDQYANRFTSYLDDNDLVTGNIYANYQGMSYATKCKVGANLYLNAYALYEGVGCTFTGRMGYDENDVSKPNTSYDIGGGRGTFWTFLNAKIPLAGLITRRNVKGYRLRVPCEHHNRTANAHQTYDMWGDVIKVACDGAGDRPSVDPDGGNGDCIELSNIQTSCDSGNPLKAWDDRQYRIWAAVGVAQTYTFKVQTTYAGISAGGLQLTASYLDEGSGGHLGEETDTPAIDERGDDTDWTQELAVTVTPAQEGWIDFQIELMEYQANDEVWIWPEVEIN